MKIIIKLWINIPLKKVWFFSLINILQVENLFGFPLFPYHPFDFSVLRKNHPVSMKDDTYDWDTYVEMVSEEILRVFCALNLKFLPITTNLLSPVMWWFYKVPHNFRIKLDSNRTRSQSYVKTILFKIPERYLPFLICAKSQGIFSTTTLCSTFGSKFDTCII